MISRRTATAIAEAYKEKFTHVERPSYARDYYTAVSNDRLYDFLYNNDHAAWLCNAVKSIFGERKLKEFFMKLHTGETQAVVTPNWSWKQREQLGQQYLESLAEDILQILNPFDRFSGNKDKQLLTDLKRALELDGYSYSDGRLLRPEEDVVEIEESKKLLHNLYQELQLGDSEVAIHHLDLSEEHYLAGRWDDAISNSRKFLECVLQEVADKHSEKLEKHLIDSKIKESAVNVRDYLEKVDLLEAKEKDALAKVYGLLSHTGGHPYMAQNDQARLLRHLALTFSQFVMLRLRGKFGVAEPKVTS